MQHIQRKTKILIVVNDFYVGGAQRLIAEQLPHFNRELFSIELLILMHNIPERASLMHKILPEIPVIQLRMRHTYNMFDLVRLFRVIKKIDPDVVISHLFLSNTLMATLKPFFRYMFFPVIHNMYTHKKIWQNIMNRFTSWVAEKTIMVSQDVADFTMRQLNLNSKNVATIANGIDLAPINHFKQVHTRSALRAQYNIPESSVVFLSVGRLTAQKNQKLLIEAFILFSKKHPGTRLYFLGEGALRFELERITGGNSNIFFMGNVDTVFDYYMMANFLISTSIIEGMSMAYLEALAFGLPIIATETGGTKELVQDGVNGYIIPKADEDTVVSILEKTCTINVEKMTRAARQKAEHYRIEQNVQKYETLALESVNL